MPDETSQRPPTVRDPLEASEASEASSPASRARSRLVARAVDLFAFSSALASAIGGTLSLVVSRLLGAPNAESWAVLAASGTFIIYNLDRLRDIDRDRASSPLRTAFVVRNRQWLTASVGIVAIGFVATLLTAPPSIILLCLAIGLLGLFHRRLKQVPALKAAYVSVAWIAACVGMPWLASGRSEAGLWIAGILLASLAANLIASNSQDQAREVDAKAARSNTTPALWMARAMAVLGIGITLAAPGPLQTLVWIPIFEGLAVAYFRNTERYSQIAVDGALLIGALAAFLHLRAATGAGWPTG